ncbi:MAG: YraN family protein [Candidatus Liptonbacteria bacterium]|nr:YraN family protein [Candidatus Liptonbacteria bacterium]
MDIAPHLGVGKAGEDLAAEYLTNKGYSILERNIREKFGEIDILAKDKKGTVHFVEVKTISAGYADYSGMAPEDNLSAAKLRKMKKICDWYANGHKELVSRGYQIDLIAIRLGESGDKNEIKFYSNVA